MSERVIAEVNGVPVLVEAEEGYRAPEGLEGVAAYLEAGGGVHDELARLRSRLRECENGRQEGET